MGEKADFGARFQRGMRRLAVHQHPPLSGSDQPCQYPQKGGFARAVGSGHQQQGAGFYLQIYAVDGRQGPISFGDLLQAYGPRRHSWRAFSRS